MRVIIKRALAPLGRVPDKRALFGVCLLALVLRVALSSISHGSNDIDTWLRFARYIEHFGVLNVYVIDPQFNHPPLMGWYGVLADRLAPLLQLPFAVVFRTLPILASVASVYLVQRVGKLKLGWLLLFAINPTDVLISAYHGNTDSVCAVLALASVFFADRERPWLAGLALGASLNVKLIPVILIAPLFCSLKPKQMWKFALALALCALPFLPIALGPWAAFNRNAIEYNSSTARWGVGLLVSTLDGHLEPFRLAAHQLSLTLGKPIITGSSVVLGLLQWRYRPFTRVELCALALSIFLVFAPGFGVQYLVYPTAFLVASHTRGAFGYVYLAGLCALLIYFGFLIDYSIPLASHFHRNFDERSTLVGLLAWVWLVRFLARAVAALPRRIHERRAVDA